MVNEKLNMEGQLIEILSDKETLYWTYSFVPDMADYTYNWLRFNCIMIWIMSSVDTIVEFGRHEKFWYKFGVILNWMLVHAWTNGLVTRRFNVIVCDNH